MALAIVLTAMITATATYAAFLLYYEIQTTIIVKPVVSMGVFDIDGVTDLITIDMGQIERDGHKYYPGGTPTAPTQFFFINNTDQMSFYVDFLWSNLPAGTGSIDVFIKRGDQTTFTQRSATDPTHSSKYNLPIMTPLESTDPAEEYAVWYFEFRAGFEVPFGTYHPVLTITAWDSLT